MANTTNFNWETPDDTDLVKDGAAAIRTLGSAIDTSLVDLKGGTTGQILSKATNTDMDFTWITNDVGDITEVVASAPLTGGGASGSVTVGIQDGTTAQKGAVQLENSTSSTSTTTAAVPASVKSAYDLANAAIPKSLVDAAGDLIYATANDTVARLGIGTAGQVLKVNSGATAPEWGAAGGTAGLNLITTETFSGVSDYTKDSLFSTTYDNYRIIIEFVGSQNAALQYQLRSGGSNITSANYQRQVAFFASTTTTLDRATNDTNNSLGNTFNTGRNLIIMDLASPFLSQHKTHISNAFNTTNTANLNLSNGAVLVTTSCTGIRFFPNNGTITGTVSYYGYGK